MENENPIINLSLAFAIFIIIILAISPACALENSTMEGNTVTIKGFDFFIPEEYTFNQNSTDALSLMYGYNYHREIKSYISESGGNISIIVRDKGNGNVDKWVENGHPFLAVNGKRGILDELTAIDMYSYQYIEGDQMIIIQVDDPDLLEWIIV